MSERSPDQKWYDTIRRRYAGDILRCVQGAIVNDFSVLYTGDHSRDTKVSCFKTDTVSALFAGTRHNPAARYAVLNFASYHNPGGGFLKGAKAQEEALCRTSILYPVLNAFRDIWYWPHSLETGEVYTDDFILVPDCSFIRGSTVIKADVLTMAAVNQRKVKETPASEVSDIVLNRMLTAYKLLGAFGATRVILGAWGCGVFKNDPAVVAGNWRKIVHEHPGRYDEVIHAVPDTDTYTVFKKEC